MSISKIEDILPRYQEIANGSKKEFSVDFALLEDRFVSVYVDSEKLVSGYKVNVDGGKITFDSAPAKGKNITIVRAVPISWEDTFNGALNSSSLNSLLIYLTASIQTVKEEVSRAVKTSISDNINGGEVSEFFLKQLTDAKDILDKSENTLALLTTTIQDALISIEAARVGAVEDVEALVGRAENTLNGKADLNKNNTFTGTNTFTSEIKRSVALSGGGSHAIKTIDTNGKGETSTVSYYTGNRIYNRMLALNYTSSKNAYFEVTVDNSGDGTISFAGSATEKYVNFHSATKVRVPTPGSSAENGEAVNVGYLNNKLDDYLPLAGGTMIGPIIRNGNLVHALTNTNRIILNGGLTNEDSAGLYLFGGEFTDTAYTGSFMLRSKIPGGGYNDLIGNPEGELKWCGNHVATTNNTVNLTDNQTISGTKTFTKQIIRNVPLSGASEWTLRTVDTNGKGYTASVSYYTGGNIYNRTVAHNNTADKNAYFDVMVKDDGTAYITFNGSATEKYVNFHSATKVRVPTPGSSAENGEAVNVSWCNGKFLPLAGGTMSGNISFSHANASIKSNGSSGQVGLQQGDSTENGASLWLYGNSSSGSGKASLQVYDKNAGTYRSLDICPDGSLTWQGKDVVTTSAISKSGNGYVKLGNGLIIQWGQVTGLTASGTSSKTVTLPTAFTSTNYRLSITSNYSSRTQNSATAIDTTTTRTTTGFTFHSSYADLVDWIAIGY